MSDTASTSTLLACPECGETSFSWIVHQVQFGIVHQFDADQYSEEGRKMGEITNSDVDENGVFCTTCEESRRHEDLVPANSVGTSGEENS